MHELSLMKDLLRKVEAVAAEQRARAVVSVRVRLGALSHVSSDHLREHFTRAARGTVAEGARLDTEVLTEVTDPHAHEILLDRVEVED
jgi:hydrogenase nickel incorporation protein HypA/HybF